MSKGTNDDAKEPIVVMATKPPTDEDDADRTAKILYRTRFLILMRILFKLIEGDMRDRARSLVRECKKRHKDGVPGYAFLEGAISQCLRQVVGEEKWLKAIQLCHYHYKTRIKKSDQYKNKQPQAQKQQQPSFHTKEEKEECVQVQL
eukprot:CAMPEP_0118677704 /NCGR_PEP_ID=MMETSP0800-20121206/2782_1 /TAXON_ID=210618 ORGANISM="Striatella unipunctata, Strain CCMP2910" /NCGR_SAMPLE_ID=MMETSP0800 /ASSEMBLY_ACC=CAM_ASM_000638 /LENGTH=146 /DNA_ID=CAMNT_0006573421 /DNA_START=170 /DNA_END=610 /DNA_ORIENTATION=-